MCAAQPNCLITVASEHQLTLDKALCFDAYLDAAVLIAHKVQANLVCDTGAGLSEGPPQKRAKDYSWSTVAGKAKSGNAGSAITAPAAAATGSGPSPADLKKLASENKPSAQLFG